MIDTNELRRRAELCSGRVHDLLASAADEIERLREELDAEFVLQREIAQNAQFFDRIATAAGYLAPPIQDPLPPLDEFVGSLRSRLAVLEGAAREWARQRRYSPGAKRTKAAADALAALLPGEGA